MILREWRAAASADRQDEYPSHFQAFVLPRLRESPGFLGAALTSRGVGNSVEFMVLTKWESLESIRAFSGEPIHAAVVDREAVALLDAFDREVRHHTILVCTASPEDSA